MLELHALPQLALATHPDKNPDNEEAIQQFQEISEMYHVLAKHWDGTSPKHEFNDLSDESDSYNDYDFGGG